jgi:hypothetical protein
MDVRHTSGRANHKVNRLAWSSRTSLLKDPARNCRASITGKRGMHSRVSINNFRGIESLEAKGLRRINLIVGRNNSGKTTFLESLFLLGSVSH